MKYHLVDQIIELAPRQHIKTAKSVTLAEEYLSDHFPSFPVMPGVLMLECMVQSAAWLVRASEDFAHSLLFLHQAKNVVYKSFVPPGSVLVMDVQCQNLDHDSSVFVGKGRCDQREVVKARIALHHRNLADHNAKHRQIDLELIAEARQQFARLTREHNVTYATSP